MSRNTYLLRKYGITEEEYNQMLTEQDGVCKISKLPQKSGISLHVEHSHKVAATKVLSKKIGTTWYAWNDSIPNMPKLFVEAEGRTKSEAIRKVKRQLLRLSVRGLTGWLGNSLLAAARDSAELLESAAAYLRRYEQQWQ